VKRQFVRWRLAQTPYNLNERRRRVREDVRIEEEWFDPRERQRRASMETKIELRPTNKWRLTRVLITT
jgi:hypothetical protein